MNEIDMIHGGLWKKIIAFSLPLAATSILQQLFNSADVAVVGRFAGSDALAAVGANVANVGIFVNFLVGFSVGPNVVLSRLIGRQDENEAKKLPGTTIFMAFVTGLIFFVLGEILTVPLLKAISTPERVLSQATLYFRIYVLGFPFLAVYNFGSALLRSTGDTKRPLYTLIFSGIVNLILNLVFVIAFKMGVSGVAWATVISSVLSGGVIITILCREKGFLHLGKNIFHPDLRYLKNIAREGFAAGFQSSVFSISNMFIQWGINSFGPEAIAGSAAGLNFEYFTWDIAAAFAQGTVTFTSQNFGAGKLDRCRKVFWISLWEGVVFTAVLCGIFTVWSRQFVRLYTVDPEVIDFALRRMYFVMSWEFLTAVYEVGCGALRGIGHPMIPSVLTIFGTVVFRIIWLATLFKFWNSYEVLMLVYPASWIFTFCLVLAAYRREWRKLQACRPGFI